MPRRETSLRLAKDLMLPLSAATETFAILGRRGSGKTHTAVVMAEEMLSAGVQLAILDPLDAWSGLRIGKDGKSKGYAIYLFGGSHGDLPLLASSGAVLADAVVDHGLSVVLSLRHLSKTDQRRFTGDFCERLYDRKGEPAHRTALHVIIDEADAFVPQRLVPGSEKAFGAVDTLIRRGRSSGLATTLISQRPQVINKDVLSQTEVLVAHQLTGPQDRKALEAWIEANDVDNRRAEFMASLASLPRGTAWFWSPGLLAIFRKVAVRDRLTFDSSATPAAGARAVNMQTAALAPVDLQTLEGKLKETIERAKADDPRELRKTIADLQRQIAAANSSRTLIATPISEPVMTPKDIEVLAKLGREMSDAADYPGAAENAILTKLQETIENACASVLAKAATETERRRAEFFARYEQTSVRKVIDKIAAAVPAPAPHRHTLTTTARPSAGGDHGPRPSMRVSRPASPGNPSAGRSGPEQRVLDAIAELEVLGVPAPERIQVALIAGYSNLTSKGFANAMGSLRTAGLIAYPSQGCLSLTDDGRHAANYPERPSTPAELHERVLSLLGGVHGKVLRPLLAAYPDPIERQQLASQAGYENLTSKGFANAIGRLRTLGFIDYPGPGQVVAKPVLFLEA